MGAYALAAHGFVRATGDIDLWVRPAPQNAERVLRALRRFGAPPSDVSEQDLVEPDIVFQIGVAPRRIDILTTIDGVTFGEAWAARDVVEVEGIGVPVISRAHLAKNKEATGRPQDLGDAAWLRGASDEEGERS